MKIELVAAMAAPNGAIGYKGNLPWKRQRADMRHFEEITKGGIVLMGRKTLDSLGGALRGRTNIVLSRTMTPSEAKGKGCTLCRSLSELKKLDIGQDETVYVIGGGEVFLQLMPEACAIRLTYITPGQGQPLIEGDTGFPYFAFDEWEETHAEAHPADEENEYAYEFVDFRRKNNGGSKEAKG